MKRLAIYVDTSVIGGCEDEEFRLDSLALWQKFLEGSCTMVLSTHTLREMEGAPEGVKKKLTQVPTSNVVVLEDNAEAFNLADAYLRHGIVGRGSRSDALHVALATVGRTDVIVSWNFKQIVNLGRIRLFQAVNIEHGYPPIEIRTPKEVLEYE